MGQQCRFAHETFPWADVTPAARTVMHRDASRPLDEMLDDGDCASKHRARRVWEDQRYVRGSQSRDQREQAETMARQWKVSGKSVEKVGSRAVFCAVSIQVAESTGHSRVWASNRVFQRDARDRYIDGASTTRCRRSSWRQARYWWARNRQDRKRRR